MGNTGTAPRFYMAISNTYKLDGIKAELLALEPGAILKIHHSRIAEALQVARRPMYYHPSADEAFVQWCGENGIGLLYFPATDYIHFEKAVANAKWRIGGADKGYERAKESGAMECVAESRRKRQTDDHC